MPPYCDCTKPFIMDWTVLPAKVAAKAWIDPQFRQALLAEPMEQIRSMMRKSVPPEGVTFCVHENTESVRHFPLPAIQDSMADLPREVLKQKVEEETGDATDFEYFLPAPVIFRSLVDPAYRACLLADADATLRADGFTLESFGVQIHENTALVQHLALPVNAWMDEPLDYDALVQRSFERMLA